MGLVLADGGVERLEQHGGCLCGALLKIYGVGEFEVDVVDADGAVGGWAGILGRRGRGLCWGGLLARGWRVLASSSSSSSLWVRVPVWAYTPPSPP